jgi:ethylmalonyl-CoA mutase
VGEGAHVILVVDESAEREQIERSRRSAPAQRRRGEARSRACATPSPNGQNVMPPSIRAAHAGVTTGEWADVLRALFGEYRAPDRRRRLRASPDSDERLRRCANEVRALAEAIGRPPKILVGKPGLDGHSNGAEQIAVRARDVGMEVVYEGIRLTPEEIVQSARDEGVHVIGLSILSGSHGVLVVDVLERLRAPRRRLGAGGGGRHHPRGRRRQAPGRAGVRRVYTPKDWDLNRIMAEIATWSPEAAAG